MNDSVKVCHCLKDTSIPKGRDVYCARLDEQDDDED
jgi:hypothetical protein